MSKDDASKVEPKGKAKLYANWLSKQIGKDVEIYCNRSPKASGKLVFYDPRFGKIIVESDTENVEMKLSDVQQIRWPRSDAEGEK